MKNHAFLALSALILSLSQNIQAQTDSVVVASPNGQIQMTIATVEKNVLSEKGG